jgi:6-pyruvoyl-tetrahydropterin synthase
MVQLFVNRLTVIDFSYLHGKRGLLGESWLLDLELEGDLDEQGMVLDFALVKQRIKGFVDGAIDHRLLVPSRDPRCHVSLNGDGARVEFGYGARSRIWHQSPSDAICAIAEPEISPRTLAQYLHAQLLPQLPENIHRLGIHLYPEAIPGACYQYSHGLKQHQGNCQRIAHGHRSRLDIQRNGQSDSGLEQEWVRRWRDRYIANREDLVERKAQDGEDYYCFAYHTLGGPFRLEMPAAACYLIDGDSTVENLARYIANQLHLRHPDDRFQVRAYEGVDKGAVARAEPAS